MVFADSITVFVSCRMKIQSNTYTEVYFRSLLGQRTLRKTDNWIILKWQVEICINKTSDGYTFLELLLFFLVIAEPFLWHYLLGSYIYCVLLKVFIVVFGILGVKERAQKLIWNV